MNRFVRSAPFILLAVQALLPAAKLIAAVCGWNIRPANAAVYAVMLAAAALAIVIAMLARRDIRDQGRAARICLALALPMSILNALVLPLPGGALAISAILVNIGSCVLAFPLCKGLLALRIIAGMLTGFLMLLAAMFLLFSGFGVTEEVHSLSSPDGRYVARVLNIDQGALGGDTVVRVQRVKLLGLPIDSVFILDTKLWMGDWGRAYSLGMTWVDGDTLRIDGIEYDI